MKTRYQKKVVLLFLAEDPCREHPLQIKSTN
ncbi:hypothetical protein EcWSU1_A046 (plasmid) [Enterobacter ludwigii]|uniref:Uncharacterized protein n=1 Tax=Enterobacter ludwigii TaxID=299767 RepID=G8LQC4_9ENTR|nr:hypothetical protein EcWSU1_A046 [Enterobacter ludwigii]